MISRREEHAISVGPDGLLYAVGGFNGKHALNTAEVYNPNTKTWTQLPSMNEYRRSLSLVSLADGIYALGGYDGARYLESVERYDIINKIWVIVTPMKHPRCAFAAIVSKDYRNIYVMGGNDGQGLALTEKYDVVTNSWEIVTPMKSKRLMHGAVLIHTEK